MDSKNDHELAKKRGRPPAKDELDPIRAKLWFNGFARNLGATSGYAVEKYYLGKLAGVTKKEQKKEKYKTKPLTGKFYKHKNGKHLPDRNVVYYLEKFSPGAAYYYDHPFWEIAKSPVTDLGHHYKVLAGLRPPLTKLLFGNRRTRDQIPTRTDIDYLSLLAIVVSQSDWDAITLALGLIREADYLGHEDIRPMYSLMLIEAYARFAARFPFNTIAGELYAYLKPSFFLGPEGTPTNDIVESYNLQAAMEAALRYKQLYREDYPNIRFPLKASRLPDHKLG